MSTIDLSRNQIFYVIIVIFPKKRTSWPGFKESYKKDLEDISYPSDQMLNTAAGINELTGNFKGLNGMEILKTLHGAKARVIFHLLIDVSKEPKLPTTSKRSKIKAKTNPKSS